MKSKRIISEQTQKSLDFLKNAIKYNCFDNYEWFEMDTTVNQPRTIKSSGLYVVTGKNTKGERVFFYANGRVKNLDTGVIKKWSCKSMADAQTAETTAAQQKLTVDGVVFENDEQVDFITNYMRENPGYELKKPSEYNLKYYYETPIDLSTIDYIFPRGKFFLYKKKATTQAEKDKIEQGKKAEQDKIEQKKKADLEAKIQPLKAELDKAGFTFDEPEIGTQAHNTEVDARKILGGKYSHKLPGYSLAGAGQV